MSAALVNNLAIPLKTQLIQQPQHRIGRAGDNPRRIKIFNPDKPEAAGILREKVASQSRQQRPKMEGTGRAGSKTSRGRLKR
jgi:hypothetical protein